MSRPIVLASAFVLLFELVPAGAASVERTTPFAGAWQLSRGEGVTVAVISSDDSLAMRVQALAPAATVSRIEPLPLDRTADSAFARAIDNSIIKGARVVLVAAAWRFDGPKTLAALERAATAGSVIVAPAGDAALSQEDFPARCPCAVGVAALDSLGALSARTNAGPHTSVGAFGASSFDAAASVAAAAGLAFGFDRTLTSVEVRRALESGEPTFRLSPRGSEPARLEPRQTLERLRPRSRGIVLRDARVLPHHAPRGERARLRVRVGASGRLPACGRIIVRLEDSPALELRYGPIRPGEEAEIETDLVARSTAAPARAGTADGGVLWAAPAFVTLSGGGAFAGATFDVVPPHQRAPSLRLASVRVQDALHVESIVENLGPDDIADGVLRMTVAGRTVAAGEVPRLGTGERARIGLEVTGAPQDTPRLEVAVELVREPPGFHETVEERWLIALDPRRPSRGRGGARR